jgi:precorrin-8X/cobalt-precorrin-8 methylmutase
VARAARGVTSVGQLLDRYGLPPAEIEARSLAWVESQLADRLPDHPDERAVAVRIVYAAGDLALFDALRIQPGAVAAAVGALRARRSVVVDVRMLGVAVETGPLARLGCHLFVGIAAAQAAERARIWGTTRSAAGMALLAAHWRDGLLAVGNAPTALLAVLDLLDAGCPPPAAIVGMPVGFVAAAEAKDELLQRGVPAITLAGTRGGAAVAAAAVNALGALALAAGPLPQPGQPALQ